METFKEYTRNGVQVKLFYDWDQMGGPDQWGNFTIVQFRDNDFDTYGDIEDYLTETGKLRPEYQAKLKAGKMFTIDYSRYSSTDGGFYRLNGGIPSGADLDSQDINGFIVFDDAYVKNVSYAERRKYAEQDLKTYTQWANGEVYGYMLDGPDGVIDSCGGFIGDAEYCEREADEAADRITGASIARKAQELHT